MNIGLFRQRRRLLPLLLAVLSFAMASVFLFVWHRNRQREVLETVDAVSPALISESRRSLSHHLGLLARSESNLLFQKGTDGSGKVSVGNCIRLRDTVSVIYPWLLSVRCYDDTFILRYAAEKPGISILPSPIRQSVLVAHIGAAVREGLYSSAIRPDYRVIVPLIAEQKRQGVVEFIFAPEVLLTGIDRLYHGRWSWKIDSERLEEENGNKNEMFAVASCPDLFSGVEHRLDFSYPLLYPPQTAFLFFLITFILGFFFLFTAVYLQSTGRRSFRQKNATVGEGTGGKDLLVLSQAVDQSNVAVMVTDINGSIEYVNQKFLQLTGYEREELMGQNPRILKSLATPPEVYDDLWRHLSVGEAWSGEFYNRKKSGELFWDVSYIAPVWDESGRVVHYVAVKEDITERKQMEVELIAAKEAAESANQAKSHFLANMSHEIRTPMNTIIGMTELTLRTALEGEQRDYLKSVIQAAENLLAILDDILDISKIEAGTLRLDPTPFALREQLRGWMIGIMIEAERKNLEIMLDVDDDVPDLLIADFIRLGQIFTNLLSNAVKFTDSGGVLARVELTGAENSKEVEFHFMVSDTGVGVAEGSKHEIFKKFSQGDSSSTRRYGGTGLGLAICSELLAKMKGRIWVDSPSEWAFGAQQGPGSTFHFTIWLGKQYEQNRSPRLDFTLSGRFKTVIILLKNQLRLKIVKKWCESGGLSSRIAAEFQQAWQWFTAEADILFLTERAFWPDDDADLQVPSPSGRIIVYDDRQQIQIPPALSGICSLPVKKPFCSKELLEQISRVQTLESPECCPAEEVSNPEDTGEKKSILVAEDNFLNQKLIGRLLGKAGYDVFFADNGLKAVDALRERNFDLVLMDIQMPEMDGVAATRRLREKGLTLPIIALTAHALKGDREKFLAAGMDDYLCKPVHQDKLYQLLEKFLKGKNS